MLRDDSRCAVLCCALLCYVSVVVLCQGPPVILDAGAGAVLGPWKAAPTSSSTASSHTCARQHTMSAQQQQQQASTQK